MQSHVYVTGISGQIGKHLGRFLREQGYFVTGVDIEKPEKSSCDEFHQIDIVNDGKRLAESLAGRQYDCLIHLAAIVAPTEEPDKNIFSVNVWGTYNLVCAASRARVGRLIFMSSESTLGFAFSEKPSKPLYVPIDEKHPLQAHDSYGLSKLLGERICLSYHHRTGSTVFSLRPPWVWIPEKIDRYEELVRNPASWAHGLWAYIVIDDLCELVGKALTIDAKGFFSFFVTAEDNGTRCESLPLLESYYNFDGLVKGEFGRFDSVISSEAACRFFSWRPRWSWRSWLEEKVGRSQRRPLAAAGL
jgi:nucleoside-diphosphate-sugar epimerase